MKQLVNHPQNNNSTIGLAAGCVGGKSNLGQNQDGSISIVLIFVLLLQPLNILLQCIINYARYKCKKQSNRVITSCVVLFNLGLCSILFSVSAFTRTYMMPRAVCGRKVGTPIFFLSHNIMIGLHYVYLLLIVLFGCELLVSAIYTTNRRVALSIRATWAATVMIWCIGILSTVLLYSCQRCDRRTWLANLLTALIALTSVFILTVYLRLYFLIKYKRKRIITPGFNIQQMRETKLCLHTRFRMLSNILVLYLLFIMTPAVLFMFVLNKVPKNMLFVYIPLVTLGNMAIGLATVLCQRHIKRCFVKIMQCSKTDLGG